MEENKEEKQGKTTGFKTVQNPTSYKSTYETGKKNKSSLGFGKGFLLPFVSGILGCSLVIGTCFGVPSIRSKLLKTTQTQTQSSTNPLNSGYVSQTSLSDYSDTAVYAANKILPSIVGIKVEYNVNSLMSMFGRQTRNTNRNC